MNSEAEVLAQLATRSLSTTENTELAEDLAKITTDIQTAKIVLGNADATVEEIQTVITTIQSRSQTLGALLLKNDEHGIISFSLDTIEVDEDRVASAGTGFRSAVDGSKATINTSITPNVTFRIK